MPAHALRGVCSREIQPDRRCLRSCRHSLETGPMKAYPVLISSLLYTVKAIQALPNLYRFITQYEIYNTNFFRLLFHHR